MNLEARCQKRRIPGSTLGVQNYILTYYTRNYILTYYTRLKKIIFGQTVAGTRLEGDGFIVFVSVVLPLQDYDRAVFTLYTC